MSAKGGKALVQSDAGAYVAWSGVDQPELTAEGLGCGLLVLRPLSFALPHYADSHKFGYVLLGSGVAGVLPVATGNASSAARERVVRLEVGDVIAVRTGDVSWWYNDSDGDADDLSILFMGDTERAVSPGDISYFFLAGGNSVLGGFDVSSSAGGETLLLDEEVAAGSVFVVPRFAVALISAGANGAEWVSLVKSARPAVEHLTGDGSVLGGLTAQVLQASLSVAPELVELLGGRSAEPSH
ncbi:unnamed protein product [Triticum turgidum subsp. durum]|uniref:Cupin type-1 domain-containing protein n=1 Tax=Triticum turgidum subsp. durum TaxID=4567 RepID=A0A9R0U0V5_TRITD|nr:unnamed protein product [Triticum turgidum subsp. durum]